MTQDVVTRSLISRSPRIKLSCRKRIGNNSWNFIRTRPNKQALELLNFSMMATAQYKDIQCSSSLNGIIFCFLGGWCNQQVYKVRKCPSDSESCPKQSERCPTKSERVRKVSDWLRNSPNGVRRSPAIFLSPKSPKRVRKCPIGSGWIPKDPI